MMSFGFRPLIAACIFLAIYSTHNAKAGTYAFGLGCSSQGAWTQQALGQTDLLIKTVTALKDNPKCKGLESVISGLKTSSERMNGVAEEKNRSDRFESIPGEVSALRSLMNSSPEKRKELNKLLLAKTLEGASLAVDATTLGTGAAGEVVQSVMSLKERTHRAAHTGLDAVDQFFKVLPNYDECLIGNPNQSLALLSASVKLAGAFASSGQGLTSRLGSSLANLTTMLRDRKFTKVLRKLNESEFWLSMSCLLETTTESYCSAQDAYELLHYNKKLMDEVRERSSNNGGPLEGYYILVRDIPTISSWLQQVQFGVSPKLMTDATRKSMVLDTINDFQKLSNRLFGTYRERMLVLSSMDDLNAKKNYVLDMIDHLSKLIERSTESSSENFFLSTISSDRLPFYFVGIDQVPAAVLGLVPGLPAMSWESYMKNTDDPQNAGKFIPQFSDPDELAQKIEFRLNDLIARAGEKASSYFRQQLIVDDTKLLSDAVTNQNLTVIESLRKIYKYLNGLGTRIKNDPNGEYVILGSIVDTRKRIKNVLDSFEKLTDLVRTSDLDDMESAEFKENILKAYSETVEVFYSQFNLLTMRDTMLATRLNTFVRADFSLRVRNKENMTDYERDLMIVSGKSLLDRIVSVNQVNPAAAEADLRTAQVVNKRNIEAFEEMFSDELLKMIADISRYADGDQMTRDYHKSMKESFGFLSWPMRAIYSPNFYSSSKKTRRVLQGADDKYKSFDQFRAKLCIQTLAFNDREKFKDVCGTSILKSIFDDPKFSVNGKSPRLSIAYSSMHNTLVDARENSEGICAYRQFNRRNLVHWLTQDFSEE